MNESFELDQLPLIAEQIIKAHPESRIMAFYGKMGVGKTTLIKAICDKLGVTDTVGSPTFSIVNQYLTKNNHTLYHFDFYRLKKIEEAYDIGYEDYFFSGNYCFIEWPEKIEALLPSECLKMHLEEADGIRNIKI
jgi:tRNA threonylcarbamoyladenosine biosynthesis protein TsaE